MYQDKHAACRYAESRSQDRLVDLDVPG